MIAERIQRLNQVLRKTEVLLLRDSFRPLENMCHLQRDSLDEALGMLRQLSISWRERALLRLYFEHLLNLLERIDTP